MSYDLFIYSAQEHVLSGAALKREMLSQGWEVRLTEDTFRGSQPLKMLPDENLIGECLVAGWRTEQKNSGLLDAMFAAGNAPGLTELFEKEFAFQTCGLGVTCPFIFDENDLEFDSEQELRKVVGDEVVDFRKSAKTHYDLRLSGIGAIASAPLVDALVESLLVLSEGMLDDPQKGAYYIISQKRRLIRLDSLSRRIAYSLRRRFVR